METVSGRERFRHSTAHSAFSKLANICIIRVRIHALSLTGKLHGKQPNSTEGKALATREQQERERNGTRKTWRKSVEQDLLHMDLSWRKIYDLAND